MDDNDNRHYDNRNSDNRNNDSRSNEQQRANRPQGQQRHQGRDRNHFNRPRNNREWQLLEKLLMQSGQEQKRARRWGIFFKFLMFAYLFIALMVFAPGAWEGGDIQGASKPHTALIDVNGIIMPDGDVDADKLASGLRKAFKAEHSKAIILRINSPGGSPVQSGTAYREIKRLRAKYPDKKVYAVITDIGASGAYYIAAAADEIYADPASLVGSIGVISEGFGYVGGMEKVGVERRVITSGENKAFLDPFSPLDPKHKEFFSGVLGNVHQQFINAVKEGRGDRLKSSSEVFSGLVWSGEQALPLGLIDGFGSPGSVARDVIKAHKIVDYSVRPSPFESFANSVGVSFAKTISSELGLSASQKLR